LQNNIIIKTELRGHLLRQFDDPGRGHDDVGVDAHQAGLFDLLHHEAADFVVVGRLAPRTADRYDFLQASHSRDI